MPQVIQMGRLQIEVYDQNPEQLGYKVIGGVEEEFRKDDIPIYSNKNSSLNLKGLTHFNSCGIREWIFWIQELTHQGQVVFLECSIPMIDQINMIPQSLGSGVVESFYAPYFCEKCGEVSRLITVKDCSDLILQKKSPSFSCHSCEERLTFDSIESSYFLFIDYQSKLKNSFNRFLEG